MQKERDRRAGLNTAGYVTGYRGSPLGGLDQQFARRASTSNPSINIVFQPGLNEDLAATASGARSRPRCAARASL
jgi:indolepyruvate ferredoxin oxidoreductase